MANLFNFYQGPPYGTGIYYPLTAIDFFTGVYFPESLEAGKTVGFLWEGAGIKIVEQSVNISGSSYDSNKNISNVSVSFYGQASPLITDSGILSSRFTGNLPQDNIDKVNFNVLLKSSGLRDNIDSGSLNINIYSGKHIQDNKDTISFNIPFNSGVIKQDNIDKVNFSVNVFGSFFAKSTPDLASINIQFYDVTYTTTAARVRVNQETGMSISVYLTDIFYDTAA